MMIPPTQNIINAQLKRCTRFCLTFAIVLLLSSLFLHNTAHAKPLIVATVPALGQIAEAIGGFEVDVKVLTKVGHDPNVSPPRPSNADPLTHADLLFLVGFDLESRWLPALIKHSGNENIMPGAAGYFSGALASKLIGVARGASSAQVDWAPGQNPYWWLDPEQGVKVARILAIRLSEIDAVNAKHYRQRAEIFADAVNKALPSWHQAMNKQTGAVLTYHNTYVHFMNAMNVELAGFIEPKSGIEPSTRHMSHLLDLIQQKQVKLIWVEPYRNKALAKRIADESGIRMVILPDAIKGTGTKAYIGMFDQMVKRITE